MALRNALVVMVIAFAVTACSSGPDAPTAGPGEEVCAATFCVIVPEGWSYEVQDTYISASHELAPTTSFLTAGLINMEAIVQAAGGSWPVGTPEVTRAFWTLLEEAGAGRFERSARMLGGAERSWGTHADGQMWHLVFPTGPSSAIGVELRAPNDSWETHADLVFESVTLRG